MPSIIVPDYSGGSLVNLVAELEHRLIGSSPSPRLHPHLGDLIPIAGTYVIFLFDGLGAGQLAHPSAAPFAASHRAAIDSPFPSTTTVSLATIATGLAPSQHGLLGYQLWVPEVGQVVNTIRWTTLWGDPVDYDTATLLPAPNLWERLSAAGAEPITVQFGNFLDSDLSAALYRGCRIEPAYTVEEIVEATAQLAAEPGRLIFSYVPHLDFAAHVYGQESTEYHQALETVTESWHLAMRQIPDNVAVVGTGDHGHADFHRQVRIPKAEHADRIFYGDGRAMFVKGDGATLAESLPATWFPLDQMETWWGPQPRHQSFDARAPDGVLIADDDTLLLHRYSDHRMIGNHGALTDAERLVPLLVRD
ncbi:MAG: alkaline phosphatase family protein [Acidimicrobiia bacterium]|nr:MAG: alkaline phosphatase family protein [Acidimicrobiia bacterium]